ncbi:MAG: carboxypeptidase regulatory-like domain-containing protein [Myxococcales bacterium]|nr:carboxypeptidase regulatory-like domain-containing protein [Myxococcales bacterium]
MTTLPAWTMATLMALPPGVVEPVDAEPEPAPVEPEPVAAEPEDEPDSASLVLRLPRQAHAEVEHADTRKVEGTITGEGMIVLPPGDYRLEVGASHRPGESIRWRRTLTVRAGDDLSLDIAVRKPGWLTISGIPLAAGGFGMFVAGAVLARGNPLPNFDRTSGSLFGVGIGLLAVGMIMVVSKRPRIRVCTREPRPELARTCP